MKENKIFSTLNYKDYLSQVKEGLRKESKGVERTVVPGAPSFAPASSLQEGQRETRELEGQENRRRVSQSPPLMVKQGPTPKPASIQSHSHMTQ